jgi:dolichyl-phosphate-mannose--protein O-mannosyl transferase
MVGFFAMAFVGVHTVGELWALFCDSTIPLVRPRRFLFLRIPCDCVEPQRVILRHFLIRTLALIVLPSVFIYLVL